MKKLTLDQKTLQKIQTIKGYKSFTSLELARKLGITIEAVNCALHNDFTP